MANFLAVIGCVDFDCAAHLVKARTDAFANTFGEGILYGGRTHSRDPGRRRRRIRNRGVGKTHLVVSALKTIVLRGHSGLFYDYRELLKAIQDSYNPENQVTEMSVLEPVLKAEILVLDDVGSSKPSLWALETVGHILNTRYNEKRVTLLTTNFLDSDAAIANPPSPSGLSKHSRFARRVHARRNLNHSSVSS